MKKKRMGYYEHLIANWKVCFKTRYHYSWLHTINDIVEHFVHGLIPCIYWKH